MLAIVVIAVIAAAAGVYAWRVGMFVAPPPPTGVPDPLACGVTFVVRGRDVPLHNQRLRVEIFNPLAYVKLKTKKSGWATWWTSDESNAREWTLSVPSEFRGLSLRFSVSNACPVSSLEVFSTPVERVAQ